MWGPGAEDNQLVDYKMFRKSKVTDVKPAMGP